MAYTVVGDNFAQWVKQQIEIRNAKVATDRDLMIEMDPDVAAAFATSTSISRKFSYKPQFLTFLYQSKFVI